MKVTQNVAAAPGAPFFGSVYVASDGGAASATLNVSFLDADFLPIALGEFQSSALVTSTSFQPLSVNGTAPPGTDSVTFTIMLAGSPGPLSAYVDSASFDQGAAPPPTATEVPTATPTSTPTSADTPPTASDGATPTATHTPKATATEKPVRTATPTKTPKPGSTATPTKAATATKTAKPTATKASTRTATPTPTGTPQPGADSGAGGMLADGDFEQDAGGVPAAWSKFGGTMSLSDDAYDGDHAALLTSTTTSTKWLYQAVPVDGGGWYEGDAVARVEGDGEASLRLSWYTSADGSGSAIDEVDGSSTDSADWTSLSTGAVQAPSDAQSVRFRLMLRPASSAEVSASFDDASLVATDAPAATPTPTEPAPADGGTPLPAEPTAAATGAATTRPGATTAARSTSTGSRAGATSRATAASGRTATPRAGSSSATPAAGSLRFSELLTAGDGDDGGDLQWVELVNAGSAAVSTEGWTIGTSGGANELAAARIPAGGYAVVATNATALDSTVPTIPLASGDMAAGIGVSGDELHLFTPDGTELDAISFGDDSSVFDPAPLAPEAGQTIGLLDPAADHDGVDWALTDHATPGESNVFSALPAAALAGNAQSVPALHERSGEPSATVVWVALGTLLTAGIGGTAAYSQRRRIDSFAQRIRRGR